MSLPNFDHPFNSYELQAVERAVNSGAADGVAIIDCREDFEVAAVPPLRSAIVIPIRELEEAFRMWGSSFKTKYKAAKPGKNDRIVVYALNARRASPAVDMIRASGYKQVTFLHEKFSEYMDAARNEGADDL